MPTILPDCMMPDGADPCAGYRQLVEQNGRLRAELATCRGLLREWRNTPFFNNKESWEAWVVYFRGWVDAALEDGA